MCKTDPEYCSCYIMVDRLLLVIIGLLIENFFHQAVSASTELHNIESHYGYEWKQNSSLPHDAGQYNMDFSTTTGRNVHKNRPRIRHTVRNNQNVSANVRENVQSHHPSRDIVEYYGYPPYHQKKRFNTSRGLVTWMFGKEASKAFRAATWNGVVVGAKIVRFPLVQAEKVVNAASYIASLSMDFSGNLVREITSTLGEGWQIIRAIKLPGFFTVIYFVGGVISVVSEVKKTILFLKNLAIKSISAVQAFGIYTSLELVSGTLGSVMRTLYMDCVLIKPRTIKVGKFLVDELHTSEGRVCGISQLHAINNVTITRNDRSFLIAKVPYAIDHLRINFKAVNVTNFSGLILENTPMMITIGRVLVEGRVSFQAGTLIRFILIRLQLKNFEKFQIKIKQKDNRTTIMDIIENIENILGVMVKESINDKLKRFGGRISKAITGE